MICSCKIFLSSNTAYLTLWENCHLLLYQFAISISYFLSIDTLLIIDLRNRFQYRDITELTKKWAVNSMIDRYWFHIFFQLYRDRRRKLPANKCKMYNMMIILHPVVCMQCFASTCPVHTKRNKIIAEHVNLIVKSLALLTFQQRTV